MQWAIADATQRQAIPQRRKCANLLRSTLIPPAKASTDYPPCALLEIEVLKRYCSIVGGQSERSAGRVGQLPGLVAELPSFSVCIQSRQEVLSPLPAAYDFGACSWAGRSVWERVTPFSP